jgi:hypothetical protein
VLNHKYKKTLRDQIALGIVLLLVAEAAIAAEVELPAQTPKDATLSDSLTATHRRFSSGINTLSTDIDNFFSRDTSETESLNSRIRLGYSANYVESENPAYDVIFGAKIVLPKTQKKLQFILFSDEDDLLEATDTTRATTTDVQATDAVRSQKFNMGLRNVFRGSKTSGVVLDAGIKLRTSPDPFTRLSARRTFFLSGFELRMIERLYWFESNGWGSSVTIDLDRPLSIDWLFRFSNNGVLDHESGLWKLDHYFALFQKLNDRTAVGYKMGITADDEPTSLALETYYAAINYRYALLQDWLFFQATPRITWPREKGFTDVPSILFKIEATFGG